ncbi:MMPL family transporter [Cytobacillus kochii]|uniref:MMPL family transporter n=1 Tax=Cytobacillus kochii TaxID=859143 RepID=UPI00203C9E15|nr:MMPL family transporter [Cytobacillus kochii]MCM3324663.1 MMPL family transporter [Cytobacillus kochii]MCM3347132.1 MMPL family transporter [Cytobacillus kochii]
MAKYLYKLGKWAANNKKRVIYGTIGILIIIAVAALSLGPSFSDEMSIPGTESAKAGEVLNKEFSSSDEPAPGTVNLVMKAPKNKTLESEEVVDAINQTLNEIKKDKSVVSVATPTELGNLNENKEIGFATVTYDVPAGKVTEKSKDIILDSIEETRDEGIQTELAGSVAFSELEIGGISEVIGVVVAFVILALTFTSFLAAGMPIITAVVGLGMGILVILIGTNYFDIPSFALSLSAMLGLAVGIDYTLFIMSRFRQELAKGHSVNEAIAIATGTAGSAVVFAGITVVVALLGLGVAKIPFLTMMGISAAVCVLFAIIVAVTFVPAILAIFGHKIGPSTKNRLLAKFTSKKKKEDSDSNKWGNFVTKRPWTVTILGVLLLVVITLPFFHMQLGLPDNGTKSDETTERRAYDLLSEAYGPGYHSSLVVLANTDKSNGDIQENISKVTGELEDLENVKSVGPPIPNKSGGVFMISITPETGPNDIETNDLVHSIRDLSDNNNEDIELLVTGSTAVNIDISEKLNDALPLFASLIVGFAFVLLVIVFRSILVPLKAVLGFLLSLGATLGFVVFVIQDGNFINLFGFPTASPVLAFLPVIVIGVLFGLAMDYEVFLVSRMREEFTHSKDAKKAILAGLKDSGGVVTAAGLIMVAVFAGFMLAPDPIIKSMGFALTFGILFDAFVVRMAIVPAVMTIMGKAAWYLPKWLDKILPNIDVEGTSIQTEVKKRKTNHNEKMKLVEKTQK